MIKILDFMATQNPNFWLLDSAWLLRQYTKIKKVGQGSLQALIYGLTSLIIFNNFNTLLQKLANELAQVDCSSVPNGQETHSSLRVYYIHIFIHSEICIIDIKNLNHAESCSQELAKVFKRVFFPTARYVLKCFSFQNQVIIKKTCINLRTFLKVLFC